MFIALMLILLLLAGCTDTPNGPPLPEDTEPPELTVATTFADSLVQLRISATDDESGVDAGKTRVRSLRPASGSSGGAWDVLGAWSADRPDAHTLILTETLDYLLSSGQNWLEVTMADSAGNTATDTVALDLPVMPLHKRLIGPAGWPGGAAECDGQLYFTTGSSLVVVDPQRVAIARAQPHPLSGSLQWLYCPVGDSILYVSPYYQYNRSVQQWTSRELKPHYFFSVFAGSRADPDIFYGGEPDDGRVGVISRSANSWLRSLPQERSSHPKEWIPAVAVLPNDEKLYISRIGEGGVVIVDARARTITGHLDFGVGGYKGRVDGLSLIHNDRWLVAIIADVTASSEVAVVDTHTDVIIRRVLISDAIATGLVISPTGRRALVITQDRFSPAQNAVVDLSTWSVIARLDRPRAEGETRIDGGPLFRSDGKLAFVNANGVIEVYLNRE